MIYYERKQSKGEIKMTINKDTIIGSILDVLSYLGVSPKLEYFEKDHILRIMTNLCFSDDIRKDLMKENERIFAKEYHKYLIFVHTRINSVIREINKQSKAEDDRLDKDLNKSNILRTAENQNQFIDFVEDVYKEVLLEKYLENPVFGLFIKYIVDVKKRLSISKDEFSFIIDFLNEFGSIRELKLTEDQIYEKCYLPQLYTDFLLHTNNIE